MEKVIWKLMDKQGVERTKVVADVYWEYLDWSRSLLILAATISTAESPDQESVLRSAFKLQILYNAREALRFEYLLKNCQTEVSDFESLSDIGRRLLSDWRSVDEEGIKAATLKYTDAQSQILELEGKTDSHLLDRPFQTLTQNSEYRKARTAFGKRIEELNERLR